MITLFQGIYLGIIGAFIFFCDWYCARAKRIKKQEEESI